MPKRLSYAARIALVLVLGWPAVGLGQALEITVEFENAPLSDVAQAFARYSGRPVIVDPRVGDPGVTVSIHNVDWRRALDLIARDLGLVTRVDAAGNIRIEKPGSVPTQRQAGSPTALGRLAAT
jgi:type II secretory pathway component GspD/PulD (secretin)